MAEFDQPGFDAHPAERLSERQRQCLLLVAQGRTSKQIARELGLSPSTIDNHLGAAVERMGMKSRVEAARALQSASPAPPAATLAVREEPEPFRGADPLPVARDRLWSWSLPPVGGAENRLSIGRRYFHVVQIALLGTMAMTAIVMTIAGLVQLFSR